VHYTKPCPIQCCIVADSIRFCILPQRTVQDPALSQTSQYRFCTAQYCIRSCTVSRTTLSEGIDITQHSSRSYAVSHRTLSDPALYLTAQYQILRLSYRKVSDPALYHTLQYHILRYMTEHSVRCTVSHRTVLDPVLYHMAQYQILCCITQQSIIFLFCISSQSVRGGIDDGCFCSVGSTIKVDFRGSSSRESTLMEFIGNNYPPPLPPTFITNFS
jgi:hypothetical protein